MAFWDGSAARRARREFDSGSAATNSIELTKRHPQVSLTKQGAATGNLRVNLSWRMRTSDFGGGRSAAACCATRFKTLQAARWCRRTPRAWSTSTSTWLPVRAGRRHQGRRPAARQLPRRPQRPAVRQAQRRRPVRLGIRRDALRQPRPPRRDQAAAGLRLHLRPDPGLRPYPRHRHALPEQRPADRDRPRRAGTRRPAPARSC